MTVVQKTNFIKDIKDKDSIESAFLIKHSAVAVGKSGKPYMNFTLADKTGEIDARLFDDVQQWLGQAVAGAFIKIEGRCQVYQGRKQIVMGRLQILNEDEIDPKDFVRESTIQPEKLYEKLLSYVASMRDSHYRALAEAVLKDDSEISDRMKRAPAAKSMHHAYRGGLLEHVLSITETLDHFASHYAPYVDRDLMFLGGFFHDIGKLWELSYEGVTDYTMEGRLIGHHVIGVELVEQKIRELEAQPNRLSSPFPIEKKLLVKHMVIAHHGKLEYGSPKEPACLEALLVHVVDDLDSKVNAIRMFTENDLNLGAWTGLNRQFERYFYKPEWARKDQTP